MLLKFGTKTTILCIFLNKTLNVSFQLNFFSIKKAALHGESFSNIDINDVLERTNKLLNTVCYASALVFGAFLEAYSKTCMNSIGYIIFHYDSFASLEQKVQFY